MRRLLRYGLTTTLFAVGLMLVVVFAFVINWDDPRDTAIRDVAAVAGLGLVSIIGGGLLVIANSRGTELRGARFPPLWIGCGLLAAAVGGGAVAARWNWLPAAEPLVAVVGLIGLFIAIGRLVTRWASVGAVSVRTVTRAAVWGMFAATGGAVVLQLAFAGLAILAVLGGLVLVDPSLIGGFVDRVAEQGTLEDFSGNLMSTATVVLGITTMYAVIAPLTEEFTKLLGAAVVLRGAPASAFSYFAVGACVGLGFAVVETLGYALAAGSAWPLLLLVRAPVAFIHVTATAIASYGLYRQRARGGYRLVPYFVAAVLIHGAWNGLTVAVMLLSTQAGDTQQMSTIAMLLILVVVGMLALVLTACVAWTALAARKLGKATSVATGHRAPGAALQRLQVPVVMFERSEVRGIGL